MATQSCRNLVQWMHDTDMTPSHLLETEWDERDDVYLASLGKEAQAEIDRVEDALESFFARFTMRQLYEQALQRRLLLAPVSNAQIIIEDPQLLARAFFKPSIPPTSEQPGSCPALLRVSVLLRCRWDVASPGSVNPTVRYSDRSYNALAYQPRWYKTVRACTVMCNYSIVTFSSNSPIRG